MKLRMLAFVLFGALLGCTNDNAAGQKYVDQGLASTVATSVDSPKVAASSQDSIPLEDDFGLQDVEWAQLKPKAERDALQHAWEEAATLELAYLKDSKIDQWMEKHPLSDTTETREPMVLGELKALTARQLLYYAIENPEEYSQICSPGMGGFIQALSRKLPFDENGELRSDRQTDALQAKHKEVEKLVASMLRQNMTVSKGMLFHIADLELHAAILPLIDIYIAQKVKDDLIVTTLSELMERGEGYAYLKTPVFKTMLLDAHYIAPLTPENAQMIIEAAQKYLLNAKEDQWK